MSPTTSKDDAPDSVDSDSIDDASDGAKALSDVQRSLQAGELPAALEAAEGLLESDPENAEAMYLLAVCQRYAGDNKRALKTLDRLQSVAPEHARCFQERGHLCRIMGLNDAAKTAYSRAVELNPALVSSWQSLAELIRSQSGGGDAEFAQAQADRLSALPKELLSVTSFLYQGRLFKADQLCRAFLRKNPRHVEAMRLLAELASKLHIMDDAEFLLESALEFEPDYLPVRIDYVGVLQKRQKYEQALAQARIVRETQAGVPTLETLFANASVAAGKFDEGLAIYDEQLKHQPLNPTLHLARGHALKTLGRQDEAINAYHQAAESRPDFGDAFWSLANLKTYQFSDSEIRRMQRVEANEAVAPTDRWHLCFALGKAFEDLGDFDESFRYYQAGNAFKRRISKYRAETMTEDLQLQAKICDASLLSLQEGRGCRRPDPIFIVGLPRAGSTLLEQILASHSQVDGTLELQNILALVRKLEGRTKEGDPSRYPGVLTTLSDADLTGFGEQYLEDTQFLRARAPFFTDKMPNNFRHLGLIRMILPDAKIIDARRDAMDCCFSGFKQLFAEGQEFTYSLEDVGTYYRDYVSLMDHWDKVLPGWILRVQHEDVVDDLEGQVRRLLDFCGLPFEDACVEFHRNERAVRTASSEQVRQPIYRSSLAQWRHYEAHLEPLKRVLGPVAIDSE
ncbi:sulfotransferase [Gammaproteobacteria bacterium]|nr:sulfotransferase [Gammaproteobacteria bacterium]